MAVYGSRVEKQLAIYDSALSNLIVPNRYVARATRKTELNATPH
ncbi:hypothetical protein SBDP1_1680009 [Syntrophobacter sp. SbD1]|nr:hypothetical protein SBDP1_1680009 [Syntrophobacter sp. SbD1]